jgi:arylsulfatase
LPTERPNILWFFPDQWRADCLEHLGHPVVETPFLSELAEQSVTFTSAYTPCPSCISTRASLITGLSPSRTGRLGYKDGVPWHYENTLMERLRNSGYQTINVGKTHFYPQRAHLGYEINDLYDTQKIEPGFDSDYNLWLRDKTDGQIVDTATDIGPNSWLPAPWVHPEHLHPSAWNSTRAIEHLERRDPSRPFFMALNYHRPHPPIDPPLSFYQRFEHKKLPPVPIGDWARQHERYSGSQMIYEGKIKPEMLDRVRRAYFAQLAHVDFQIGRVLRWLQRFGRCMDNTLVIFGSDHGEMLGDHHLWRKFNGLEASAKVPLMVRLPARMKDVPRGTLEDKPISLEDFMPTVLEEAGLAIPDALDGRSFSPLLRGKRDGPCRTFVHGEHARPKGGWQYVTDGKEKFIWQTFSGEQWFFDLPSDPLELRNRIDDPSCAGRVALWRGRLIEILAKRPQDGLVRDGQLVSGVELPQVRPELLGRDYANWWPAHD